MNRLLANAPSCPKYSDDVHAANFAYGAGLVVNPGEYVMGYSNSLWVLLLGIGEILAVSAPVFASWLGVIVGRGILAMFAPMFPRLDYVPSPSDAR